MKAIKAVYDGYDIKLIESAPSKARTEVIVVFPDHAEKKSAQEARRRLRGQGKGEGLVQKLLKSRAEEAILERK